MQMTWSGPAGLPRSCHEQKKYGWYISLGIALLILSAALYVLHFVVFHDAHHIFIYLLGDNAFIPIEVLVVTIIIHQLLSMREKKILLQKMNMLIGAFFSEVGTSLLTLLSDYDPHLEDIRQSLAVTTEWTDASFRSAIRRLKDYGYGVDIRRLPLPVLKQLLVSNRGFLARLLETPLCWSTSRLPPCCGPCFI